MVKKKKIAQIEAADEQDSSSAERDKKERLSLLLLLLLSSSVPLVSSRGGGLTTSRSPSQRQRGACSESPWLGGGAKGEKEELGVGGQTGRTLDWRMWRLEQRRRRQLGPSAPGSLSSGDE